MAVGLTPLEVIPELTFLVGILMHVEIQENIDLILGFHLTLGMRDLIHDYQ